MKVGDEVRVSRGSHPRFGKSGKVAVVGASAAWVMVVLDDGTVEKIQAADVTSLVRSASAAAEEKSK